MRDARAGGRGAGFILDGFPAHDSAGGGLDRLLQGRGGGSSG